MKLTWIVATTIGVGAIALSGKAATPLVIWNASPSVPIGFYVVRPTQPRRGQLAVVRLSPGDRALAHGRRYLHQSAYLIKPVAATEGDRVCRIGTTVRVGTLILARARARDSAGRTMPVWSGCRTLETGELFLISSAVTSFDSRYFGVINSEQAIGIAQRLFRDRESRPRPSSWITRTQCAMSRSPHLSERTNDLSSGAA